MFDFLSAERGLSLERLRVLIAVHDAGSISEAAPGDKVRHSQFSRQLRELSEFFGCEVAHRRGKVLKLTPEGMHLAELVRPFLRGLEDFHSECRTDHIVFSIAAGDSLIQWLVIPAASKLLKALTNVNFTTVSLTTNEIIRQVFNGQIDFGLIRRNAITSGMKSATLGSLTYTAVVPAALMKRQNICSLSDVFNRAPFAMQKTEGQFTKQLNEIAISQNPKFRPSLQCQSFPQTLAAVRAGGFVAIVPDIAVGELPIGSIHEIHSELLKPLQRDIVLVWNPRLLKVRSHAEQVLPKLQAALRFG